MMWAEFNYNDKPRLALILGPDTRPGTTNLICATPDGIRAFKPEKMENLRDVTVEYVL